jgi:phage terminase small subunit
MSHATHADASRPTIRVNNKLGPRGTLNGRQSKFVDEYMSNGQNGASAYRKAYGSKCSSLMCGKMAHKLLQHPTVARAVRARVRMIELAREGRLEAQQATEERIIDVLGALAFYDPRSIIQWGPDGRASITMSTDLSLEAVYAIREILILGDGGIRFKFHDRRAALMDLARLRGMITDKSASFHFHEDLARMSPDDQKRRVAELLEFAASIKVPGDSAVDVTPDDEEEIED